MSVIGDAAASRGDIMRRLRELEKQVADLQTARRLESSSIGDGALRAANFDGDLSIEDPGSEGWAVAGDGTAAFTRLILREGIIGPGALANLVVPATYGTSAVSGPSNSDELTLEVPTPEWATAASLIAVAAVGANPALDPLRFTAEVTIDGDVGLTAAGSTDDNLVLYDSIPVMHQRTWSPTPDETFDVVLSWGAAPVEAEASWHTYLSVMVVFSRITV